MVPQAVIETASAPYQGAVITFILLGLKDNGYHILTV